MKSILIALFFISFSITYAQDQVKPIIKEYGKTHTIEDPDLLLETTKEYHVIFDIYTDASEGKSENPLINTVARFLNMHGLQGVPLKHMNIAVTLHGAAAKNCIESKGNPNIPLLEALHDANVAIFVCGQSLKSRNLDRTKVNKSVKVALSAMTVLVHYQSQGYNLINFN